MSSSFGRNLQVIFGTSDMWRGMGDSPLLEVSLDEAKDVVTFRFENGSVIRFGVEGDCCSSSWIEHLEVPNDIKGQKLVSVDDSPCETPDNVDENDFDVLQCYRTVFRTAKGDAITLEYRNDSNGYYGGYLFRLTANGERDYGDDE